MRRVARLSLAVIMLLLAPVVVSAQSLLGLGLAGASPQVGVFAGPTSCGESLGPRIPAPVFYVGWGINDRRGFAFGAQSHGVGVSGITELSHDVFDNGGLWLGLSQSLQLSEYVGFMVSGWYLVPYDGRARETYNFESAGGREWTARGQWGWLEGFILLGNRPGTGFIAGFRWDNHAVRFSDPGNSNTTLFNSSPAAEAQITANAYIPLVGLQYGCTSASSNLVFRIVGFPWVPGTIEYCETYRGGLRLDTRGSYDRSAYFLEVFSEYSRKLGKLVDLGIFGKWNVTHGSTELDVRSLGLGESDRFSLGLNRTSWTFGGRFSLNFDMPF